MEIKEFGQNMDGKIVHISEVQRGKGCNCFCLLCKERLVAKKGDKKMHHFAHRHKNINCKYSRESELHQLAKLIISTEKRLWIPSSEICLPDAKAFMRKEVKLERGGTQKVTSVELEKRIQDIIPDLIVTIGGETIVVEIFVTHQVDEQKKLIIKQMGLSCIEIDLSQYKNKTIDYETLERLLLNENNLTTWKVDAWAMEVQPLLGQYKEELIADDQNYVYPHYCDKDGSFSSKREINSCRRCKHCFSTIINTSGKNDRSYCLSKLGALEYNNLNNKLGLKR